MCVCVLCVYRLEVLSSPVKYSESGQEIRRYAAFHTYDRVHISCIVCMYSRVHVHVHVHALQ